MGSLDTLKAGLVQVSNKITFDHNRYSAEKSNLRTISYRPSIHSSHKDQNRIASINIYKSANHACLIAIDNINLNHLNSLEKKELIQKLLSDVNKSIHYIQSVNTNIILLKRFVLYSNLQAYKSGVFQHINDGALVELIPKMICLNVEVRNKYLFYICIFNEDLRYKWEFKELTFKNYRLMEYKEEAFTSQSRRMIFSMNKLSKMKFLSFNILSLKL